MWIWATLIRVRRGNIRLYVYVLKQNPIVMASYNLGRNFLHILNPSDETTKQADRSRRSRSRGDWDGQSSVTTRDNWSLFGVVYDYDYSVNGFGGKCGIRWAVVGYCIYLRMMLQSCTHNIFRAISKLAAAMLGDRMWLKQIKVIVQVSGYYYMAISSHAALRSQPTT